MAFKTILVVSFVVAAQAGYVWQDDDQPAGFQPFQPFQNAHFFPLPRLPRVPFMPTIRLPQIPTVDQIKNIQPGPNSEFNGVAVRSSNKVVIGPDGKPVKTGGTTVFFNNNGEKEEIQRGNNPPSLDDPIVFPSMPIFEPFEMPPMRPIKTMKPIKPVNIEDYVPDKNTHFVGASVSSYSHASNINGVKTCGGAIKKAVNVDGDVDTEGVQFGQQDSPEEK